MKVGQSFKHQEKTKESLAIQAKAELSEGMRHALTDPEDGMLRPGALPARGSWNPWQRLRQV